MRKLYISTRMFFDHLKKHKSRLYTFSPVQGLTSTYSICYAKQDDLYCIIVNDEEMMQFMMKRIREMADIKEPSEVVVTKKPTKRKKIFSFWSKS